MQMDLTDQLKTLGKCGITVCYTPGSKASHTERRASCLKAVALAYGVTEAEFETPTWQFVLNAISAGKRDPLAGLQGTESEREQLREIVQSANRLFQAVRTPGRIAYDLTRSTLATILRRSPLWAGVWLWATVLTAAYPVSVHGWSHFEYRWWSQYFPASIVTTVYLFLWADVVGRLRARAAARSND